MISGSSNSTVVGMAGHASGLESGDQAGAWSPMIQRNDSRLPGNSPSMSPKQSRIPVREAAAMIN
jgi:hypothetical protein